MVGHALLKISSHTGVFLGGKCDASDDVNVPHFDLPVRLRSASFAGHAPPKWSPRGRATRSPLGRSVVRSRGLEPPRVSPLPPQGSASTNSATTARHLRMRWGITGRLPESNPRRSAR